MTFHMALSVRGLLAQERTCKREFRRALKWLTRDDGTLYASVDEMREALLDQIAAGNEMLPSGECDNFDPKTGCKGHSDAKAVHSR
jgi:hypothetical protein